MGLLQKVSVSGVNTSKSVENPVTEKQPVKTKSNTVGLLKKTLIINEDRLDFFKFLEKYSLSIFAVLKCDEQTYCIEKSVGFDGESICKSVSTKDFWEGFISQKQKLCSYSKNNHSIQPLYQFFSQKMQDTLDSIYVLRTIEDDIILAGTKNALADSFINDAIKALNSEDNDKSVASDFSSKDFYFFKADFTQAVKSFISSNCNAADSSRIQIALNNQIYFNLKLNFPSPSYVQLPDSSLFNIACCLKEEIPVELLLVHLRTEYKSILGKDSGLITLIKQKSFMQAD